jgi:tetratricopeptide (TPR) repeat protein
MRSPLPAALLVSLVVALPASAQCFGPVCGWGFGGPGVHFGGWVRPVWGFGYGYSYSAVYYNPWVIAPPPVAIPLRPTPGVFTIPYDDTPLSGGVDLAELRKKLTRNQEAERQADAMAKAKVDAAVKAGEFVVFEPGKAPPKRAEVPPPQLPDSPKPAPPADPKAIARLYLQRGQSAFDAGELGRATERFAAAVAADPTLGDTHFNLAQVRIARGQYAEAMDAIREGVKRLPDWADARFRADELYLAHPKRQATDVADLKAAMEASPTDTTLAFLYAHHLWFAGDKAKAGELFRTLKDKVKDQEVLSPFVK